MTEEEAKTKWCPMSRVAIFHGDIAYTNRGIQIVPDQTTKGAAHGCIASKCAMWREIKGNDPSDDSPFDPLQIVIGGYCGLAGKP